MNFDSKNKNRYYGNQGYYPYGYGQNPNSNYPNPGYAAPQYYQNYAAPTASQQQGVHGNPPQYTNQGYAPPQNVAPQQTYQYPGATPPSQPTPYNTFHSDSTQPLPNTSTYSGSGFSDNNMDGTVSGSFGSSGSLDSSNDFSSSTNQAPYNPYGAPDNTPYDPSNVSNYPSTPAADH